MCGPKLDQGGTSAGPGLLKRGCGSPRLTRDNHVDPEILRKTV